MHEDGLGYVEKGLAMILLGGEMDPVSNAILNCLIEHLSEYTNEEEAARGIRRVRDYIRIEDYQMELCEKRPIAKGKLSEEEFKEIIE